MPWLALAFLPAVWLAGVFQTSIAPAMAIRQVSPDALALLASLAVVLMPGERRPAWIALALGLTADLLSAGPLGAGAATFFLAAMVFSTLDGQVATQALGIRLLATAGFATVVAWGVGALYGLAGETSLGTLQMLARGAGVGAYTAALSVPIYLVLSWLPRSALAPAT